MSKVTEKGQITIPKKIRDKFGFYPGIDVDVITEGKKALIVRSRKKNPFLKWLNRGKQRNIKDIDLMVDRLRGRTDE